MTLSAQHLHLYRKTWNGLYWEYTGMMPQLLGGGYRFAPLEPNTYPLCYDDNVLLRQCFDGYDEGAFAGLGSTPIVLGAARQRDNVNFTPLPGSELRGRMHNRYEPALPLEWVAVRVYDENGTAFEDRHDLQLDPGGNWVVGGIAPGNYYVSVEADTFISQFHPNDDCRDDCYPSQHGTLLTVPAGGAAQGVDFAITRCRYPPMTRSTPYARVAMPKAARSWFTNPHSCSAASEACCRS